MSWSLNEIEALARKAARGAGYSWGLAEEAGRAVRWLAARGLPGPRALARLLAWRDGKPHAQIRPGLDTPDWRASGAASCPLVTGAMLCDQGGLGGDDRLIAGPVAQPLLLLPFAAGLAETLRAPLAVSWDDAVLSVGPDGSVAWSGDVTTALAGPVTVSTRAADLPPAVGPGFRAAADGSTIDALTAFASRTYAPATEESRLAGAGAGLSDND